MRSLNFLGILVVALGLTNCAKEENSGSEVQHLTAEMPACAVNKERADYLYQNLGPYVYGDRNLSYYMMQQISMAPTPLTDYIVARAKAGQFQVRFDLGNGYAGLTTGGFDMSEPTLMQFPPAYESVRQAALHELGHAVEYYSFRLAGKPGSEMNEVQSGYANAVGREGQNMWSYPTTNRYEWFASAFSQYWCSQQARNYMQSYFPNSAQFMTNLYASLNRQQSKPDNPQPQASGDSDKDGIPDNADFCPNTPADGDVFTKGMYRGCAAGQRTVAMKGSASGDDDKDGVANYYDLCPNTPAGRNVHRSGEYIGCAGGETPQDIKKLISGE